MVALFLTKSDMSAAISCQSRIAGFKSISRLIFIGTYDETLSIVAMRVQVASKVPLIAKFIFAGRTTSLECTAPRRCGEMADATDLKSVGP
jgi:hypothetical protein